MLLKTSTLNGVIEALLPKIKLAPNGTQKLRTFSVYNGKLIKEYGPMDLISNIPDSLSLYVEEIPTDEYERSDTEQLISCVHFTGDLGRLHSVPFKMVIKEVWRPCTLSNMHADLHWVEIMRGLLDTLLILYFLSVPFSLLLIRERGLRT